MTRAPTDTSNRPAAAHRFWTRWLIVACGLLAVQGASWMVIGSFDPWGLYDSWLARSLLGSAALPAEALPTLRFAIGLLGATDAAFFVLLAFVVWNAYRPGAPWAWWAITTAILVWFLLDSVFSLLAGAAFNVWLVNLPCLLLIGGPLWLDRAYFRR